MGVAVSVLLIVLALPVCLGLALLAHAGLSAAAKGMLSAAQPLADGEPPLAEAAPATLWTADVGALPLWLAVAASGLLLWLALVVGSGWLGLVALAAMVATTVLDLRRWPRVVVSASAVWRQAGWREPVQRWPLARIADVRVQEADGHGWSLRGPWPGPVAALWLRDTDRDPVLLLVSDAAKGLDAVEAVANQIRLRLAARSRAESQSQAWADADAQAAQVQAAARADALRERTPAEREAERAQAEARLAAQRQRSRAMAPDEAARSVAADAARASAAAPSGHVGRPGSAPAPAPATAPPAGPPDGRS
jgi:hypothetical protein